MKLVLTGRVHAKLTGRRPLNETKSRDEAIVPTADEPLSQSLAGFNNDSMNELLERINYRPTHITII
jgi:hypothetical protein